MKIEDLNKGRKTPINPTQPIGTSRRTAEANASRQATQYQTTLKDNQQQAIQQNRVALQGEQNTAATNFAKTQEAYDSGNLDQTEYEQALSNYQLQIDSFNSRNAALSASARHLQENYGIPDAEALQILEQSALAGQRVSYNQQTGQTTLADPSKIRESAFNRLTTTGKLTPEQANAYLDSDEYKQAISSVMSNTGLERGTEGAGQLPQTGTDTVQDRLAAVDEKYRKLAEQGASIDYAAVADEKRAVAEQYQAEKEAEQTKINEDARTQQTNANIDARTQAIQGLNMEIDSGAAALLIAGIPQEYRDVLAPVINNLVSATSGAIQGQTAALLGSRTLADQVYDGTMDKLDAMDRRAKANASKITSILDNLKTQQEQHLKDAEQAQQDRINYEEQKGLRDLAKKKTDAVNQQYAELAIGGGFGSSNGLESVRETEQFYEQAMLDLSSQASLAKKDLAVQFSGLYVQLQENHANKVIEQVNILADKLDANDLRKIGAEQSKAEAYDNAFKTFVTNVGSLRMGLAKDLTSLSGQVVSVTNEIRQSKQAQEQLGWQRLNWAIDTYGSGNVPSGVLEAIKSYMPGVDVEAIANTPTADERKRMAGSGGGGLAGFPTYMMQGDGTVLPTFKDFLIEKEKESFARGDPMFDTSPKAIASYRKEFDAKYAVTNKLNPTEIANRFAMKAGTLSGPQRKYAESQLKTYFDAGQFQLAADFVDNTGDPIPATQETDFIQALNSRYNVQKMQGLFDEIGLTYPGVGLVRDLNPLDDRVVRYKQNLTQTIPALARGIFKEVGVLTDSDIARYESSVANPSLTQAQAKYAFDDLLERVNVSMQNQIRVWDANGRRVKGLRDLYEAAPLGSSSNISTQADEEYAQSVLLGQ